MIATVIVMLLAADPTVRPARIVLPIVDQTATCEQAPAAQGCPRHAQSRYRLPLAVDSVPTSKERAIAEDGQQCQLVGARMCTSHGRTVLNQPLSNSTQD